MRLHLAALLAASATLPAQEQRFDVQSRLVVVPVIVTDGKGRLVDSLDPSDFQLLDNGRPQRIAVDTLDTGVAPVAIAIVVQAAGISAPALEKVRKISPMIQPLLTGERGCAAVVAFSEHVRWLTGCTNDPDALARAFGQLQPGEPKQARMLDAAHQAIERLRQRPNSRRILVLISESRDRGSEAKLDSILLEAQSAAVTVYAVTYSAFKTAFASKPAASRPTKPDDPAHRAPAAPPPATVDLLGGLTELARLGGPNTTQLLSSATGGATLPFTRQKGLETAIEKLSAELHTQYVLSFTPEDGAPGYHRLECRIVRPGGYTVRARPGYWSAPR